MFTNLFQTTTDPEGQAEAYDLAFVREVTVHNRVPRSRRVEGVLAAGWLLIGGKCWLVTWLVAKYQIPFSSLWVNVPTVVFALLCTWLYLRRN